jgi:hypothetical protein
MTLIISQATFLGATQVSDRLVSRRRRAVDALANKTVIYLSHRCIVSLSCTGIAWLDGMSTDNRVAELLSGEPLIRSPRGGIAMRFGKGAPLPNLGLALSRLAEQLSTSFRRLPQSHALLPFQVAVCGWEGNHSKPHFRPVIAVLNKNQGGLEFSIDRPARRWFLQKGVVVCTPPGWLTPEDRAQLNSRLSTIDMAASTSRSVVEKTLVDEVRRIAAMHPQEVGSDCMSVSLPHPAVSRRASVRFWPAASRYASFTNSSETITRTVAFTPWIVAPNALVPPQIMVGPGSTIHVGGYDIHVAGTSDEPAGKDSQLPYHVGSHRRRPLGPT